MRIPGFKSSSVSSDVLMELVLASLGSYLVFHPGLVEPRSCAVAISMGLALLFLKPTREGAFSFLGPWVPLLILWAFLSSFLSLCPGLSLQASSYLCLACSVFLTVRSLSEASRQRLLNFGFALASLAALLGVLQWLWGFDTLNQRLGDYPTADYEMLRGAVSRKRAFGPLATSGALGALLILFLPAGVEKAVRASGWERFAFFAAVLLMGSGLLASQSVGASGCLAVALLLSASRSKDLRVRWAALGTTVMAGSLVVYRGWGHWARASWENRLALWRDALRLWTSHWGMGAGAGCFDDAYRLQGLPLSEGSRFAHNIPLQTLVELGLVGGLLGLAVVWEVGRRWKGGLLSTGAGCGVLAVFFFSWVDLPWVMPEIIVATAWMAALVPLEPCRWEWRLPAIPPRWVDSLALGCLMVTGFFPPFRPWNLALAAVTLVSVAALRRAVFTEVHIWVCLAVGYLYARSFTGGSVLGSAHFMTALSLCLVFVLWTRTQEDPSGWVRRFSRIGFAWMVVEWAHFLKDPAFNTPGVFANPKHLASFLGIAFLLEMGSEQKDRWSRWAQGASFATLVAFRATAGLAGWVMGLWVLFRSVRWTRWRLLLGLGLVLLAMSLGWRFVGNHQSTPWGRLTMWKGAIDIWSEAPWFGTGPGSFEGLFQRVKEPQIGKMTRYLMNARFAHNEWLEGSVSFGLWGMILGLGVWVLAWKRAVGLGRAVLAATSVNAFFDFVWHTPVLVWQSAGAVASACEGCVPKGVSWGNAFLASGLALGIWGSAALTPSWMARAASLKGSGCFPQALQTYQEAEQLSAWDNRVTIEKAAFLDRLYLATGDPLWKTRADESLVRAMEMEPTDGEFALANARIQAGRVEVERTDASFQNAWDSYGTAEQALPLSAEVLHEKGDLACSRGKFLLGRQAYQSALELEPNVGILWVALGDCDLRLRDEAGARMAYGKALVLHEAWKDKDIAPVEREMSVLKPDVLARIRGWVRP